MTKARARRRPLTGFEWGVLIACAVVALGYLAGWRFFGLADLGRAARELVWKIRCAF